MNFPANLPPQFQQAFGPAMAQMHQPAPPPGQSFTPPWMQYFPQASHRFMGQPEMAQLGQQYGNWMQQRGQPPFQGGMAQQPFHGIGGNFMQNPQLMALINSRLPPGTNMAALQSALSPMMAPFSMMQQFGQGQMQQPSLGAYAQQFWGR